MYHDSIYFLSLCIYPLPLDLSPEKKKFKRKSEENKMKKKRGGKELKNLIMEAAV